MSDRIFYFRQDGEKQVLQALSWRSVTEATARDRDWLLAKIANGEYKPATMLLPASLLRTTHKSEV